MVTKATLDAEYSVIGCLLVDPSIAGELIHLTRPEDFTTPELRTVYSAAVKLFTAGRPVDAVTIRGVCGAEYNDLLMDCMAVTPTAFGWRTYISAMQEQTRITRLRELAARLAEVRTSDAGRELIGQAGEILSERNRTQVVTMAQALVQFYTEQDAKRRFLSWGFDKLDRRLYSDYGDFVVLAGRPSAGKTALALQMAAHMGISSSVGFYSLETSTAKLTNRLVSSRCVVDFGRINRREMTQEEWTRVAKWKKNITETQMELITASGWGVQDILSTALARRHKVVFIDYLQLLKGRGRDRFEQVTNISLDLHTMAQTHGLLVVALSQLSRASTSRADAAPTLTDLRESGQIEQDADAVLALYIDPDKNTPANDRKLRVLKNKEGTLGEFSLAFDGANQSFAEYMDGQRAVARQIKKMQNKHTPA
ncbi:MAG: hypothetical protein MR935_08670 [Agathobaculum sp.]|uniref:replicative DNA helicase n=1 Tax=Agathobaculum sp. TaxID=2048138 RepID=UPI0025BCCEB4|nr:DnaB-like helicase C-terminal domain-containing protein [Agathobaculum sp.]MCI7126248.1 hypothetical protein [Agathobaculum sp.]MDY3710915.1 DnaB-like helicase C-terminal domain-containing protein [Agathobaculum sp.]